MIEYSILMQEYENKLKKDHKKINGVFYTDMVLAKMMIDDLNIDKKDIIIDPSVGTGTFVMACLSKGFTNIYGADIDRGAIKLCKEQTKSKNIIKMDTLSNSGVRILKKFKLAAKADFVIGNPPYAPITKKTPLNIKKETEVAVYKELIGSGNNLFIIGIIRAFELLKENGIISYIVPKNFLHVDKYSLLRKRILNEKTIISITDLGAHFKNVRGEQIVITIKNSKPEKNNILIKKLIDGKFKKLMCIKQSFYEDQIILFESKIDFSIYKKLSSCKNTLASFCEKHISRGKFSGANVVNGKDIRKFGYKNKSIESTGKNIFVQNIYSSESGIIAALNKETKAGQTVTVFSDGDEKMCSYILGFLHSNLCNYFLCKYVYNNSKLTMHTDGKYLKKIPIVIKNKKSFDEITEDVKNISKSEYLSKEWFDFYEKINNETCKIYNLTNSEIKFVETKIKKIQSKRWAFVNEH